MQHSRQTAPAPAHSAAPPSQAVAGSIADNSVLQAKLASWMDRAHAALEGAEADEGLDEGLDDAPFQFLPEPDVDGGPVDEGLRLLGPKELAELGLDELVGYLDEVVGHFTAEAAALAGHDTGHDCDPAFVETSTVEPIPDVDIRMDPEELAAEEEEARRAQAAQDADEALNDEAYRSQMDNAAQGEMPAMAQCSMTALTMSLVKLAGGEAELAAAIPDVAKAVPMKKKEKKKEKKKKDKSTDGPATAGGEAEWAPAASLGQLEEQLIALMVAIDWDAVYAEDKTRFNEEDGWRSNYEGEKVIKHPYAQSYLAQRFECCADTGLKIESTKTIEDFDERWAAVQQAHDDGAEITFEAEFTTSGHVVHIVDMDAAGMTVHDPYGLCVSSNCYLVNGTAPGSQPREAVAQRCGGDAELLGAFDRGEARDDWGRNNVYTRAELQALGGLEWALMLTGAAG